MEGLQEEEVEEWGWTREQWTVQHTLLLIIAGLAGQHITASDALIGTQGQAGFMALSRYNG